MSHISAVTMTGKAAIKKTIGEFWGAKTILSFFSAPMLLVYEGNEMLFKMVIILFCIDLVLWTTVAFKKRYWNSKDFFSWATKMLVYGIFMFISVSLDKAIWYENFFTWIIFVYIIGTDSISILENLHKLGYKTPVFLIKRLKNYEDLIEDEVLQSKEPGSWKEK